MSETFCLKHKPHPDLAEEGKCSICILQSKLDAQAKVIEAARLLLELLIGFCEAGCKAFPEHIQPGKLIEMGKEALSHIAALEKK